MEEFREFMEQEELNDQRVKYYMKEYDEYTQSMIQAIITATHDSSVTFDTLKSKNANTFLPETFDGVFPKFLMNIGFTTPDGSALAQSTNDYFYNSIDNVKKINEIGMYFKWKMKLKEKSNILEELTIFDLRLMGGENKKKFISQFLIYIAFKLLQYSKNNYWNKCLVKSINTNPDNKNLKQLEPIEGECKLKNPKEYHPIHNGRLFIEDLFSRINKYFETADKKIKEAITGKKNRVVSENIKSAQENLKNAKDIIDEIKRKLAHYLSKFADSEQWAAEEAERWIRTLSEKKLWGVQQGIMGDDYFNAAFKKQHLLDLMKRPEFNHSHVFQLDKLMKTLGNKPIGSETQSPLHNQGGRKTRRRRNIRVKSRRYH